MRATLSHAEKRGFACSTKVCIFKEGSGILWPLSYDDHSKKSDLDSLEMCGR